MLGHKHSLPCSELSYSQSTIKESLIPDLHLSWVSGCTHPPKVPGSHRVKVTQCPSGTACDPQEGTSGVFAGLILQHMGGVIYSSAPVALLGRKLVTLPKLESGLHLRCTPALNITIFTVFYF